MLEMDCMSVQIQQKEYFSATVVLSIINESLEAIPNVTFINNTCKLRKQICSEWDSEGGNQAKPAQ